MADQGKESEIQKQNEDSAPRKSHQQLQEQQETGVADDDPLSAHPT